MINKQELKILLKIIRGDTLQLDPVTLKDMLGNPQFKETLTKFNIEKITFPERDGNKLFRISLKKQDLQRFGVEPFDRMLTLNGPATVLGYVNTQDGYVLLFHIDNESGASCWLDIKDKEFLKKGFSFLPPDTISTVSTSQETSTAKENNLPKLFITRLTEAITAANKEKITHMLHCLDELYQQKNFSIPFPDDIDIFIDVLLLDQKLFELLLKPLATYLSPSFSAPEENKLLIEEWSKQIKKILMLLKFQEAFDVARNFLEVEIYQNLLRESLNNEMTHDVEFFTNAIPAPLLREILANNILTEEFIATLAKNHPKNTLYQCAMKFSEFLKHWGDAREKSFIPLLEAFRADFALATDYLVSFITHSLQDIELNYQDVKDLLLVLKLFYEKDKNKQLLFHDLLRHLFPLDFTEHTSDEHKDRVAFTSNKDKSEFFKTHFLPVFPQLNTMVGDNQAARNSTKPNEQPLVIKETAETPTPSGGYLLAKAEIEIWDLLAYGPGVEYLLQIPIQEFTEVEINLLKEIAERNVADLENKAKFESTNWSRAAELKLARFYLYSEQLDKTDAVELLIKDALIGNKESIDSLIDFSATHHAVKIKNIGHFARQWMLDQTAPTRHSIEILSEMSKEELILIEEILFSNADIYKNAIHYLGSLYYSPKFIHCNPQKAMRCWERAVLRNYQPSIDAIIASRNTGAMFKIATRCHKSDASEQEKLLAIKLYGIIASHAEKISDAWAIKDLKYYLDSEENEAKKVGKEAENFAAEAARKELANVYKKTGNLLLKDYAKQLFLTKMAKENLQNAFPFKSYVMQELQTLKQVLAEKIQTIENNYSHADSFKKPTLVQEKLNYLMQVAAIDTLGFQLQCENDSSINTINNLLQKAKTNIENTQITNMLWVSLKSLINELLDKIELVGEEAESPTKALSNGA